MPSLTARQFVILIIMVYPINCIIMFKRIKDIQQAPIFNLGLGAKSTKLPIPSIVSQFMRREVIYFDGDEKRKAVAHVDDIYMLFNQQRLSSAGVDTVKAWLNQLTPKSDALGELRKKCSDEQLLQLCKSRYIQSPSELLAWSEYLNQNFEQIVCDAKLAAQMRAQQQQQQQQPDAAASE